MKRPIVFSLLRDQSAFMTAIMALLTFLAVLAFGVSLAIGTGVVRWNRQWDLYATVQVTNPNESAAVKKILDDNAAKIKQKTEITKAQMESLMAPWVSGGGALANYLPQMWEVEFKSTNDLKTVAKAIDGHARVLTHAESLRPATSMGWKMILLASMVLAMALGAIGICISYIARNTAMLHRRELEILNQIGATDGFIARQMQMIVGRICLIACTGGLAVGAIMLLLILSAAASARVGLMAMMGLNAFGWGAIIIMTIAIFAFAIWITRRTTLNILKNS